MKPPLIRAIAALTIAQAIYNPLDRAPDMMCCQIDGTKGDCRGTAFRAGPDWRPCLPKTMELGGVGPDGCIAPESREIRVGYE